MRLRFSRTADYGLRAVLEVARAADGQLVSRRELSRVTGAPLSVLAQPLAALVRAGVLVAQAGPRGGYRLARPARDVSVYDVVLAIDGDGRSRALRAARGGVQLGGRLPVPCRPRDGAGAVHGHAPRDEPAPADVTDGARLPAR